MGGYALESSMYIEVARYLLRTEVLQNNLKNESKIR